MDSDGLLEMFHCSLRPGCSQVYVALSSFQVSAHPGRPGRAACARRLGTVAHGVRPPGATGLSRMHPPGPSWSQPHHREAGIGPLCLPPSPSSPAPSCLLRPATASAHPVSCPAPGAPPHTLPVPELSHLLPRPPCQLRVPSKHSVCPSAVEAHPTSPLHPRHSLHYQDIPAVCPWGLERVP